MLRENTEGEIWGDVVKREREREGERERGRGQRREKGRGRMKGSERMGKEVELEQERKSVKREGEREG